MKLILEPHWIAEECFLYEALLWVAFHRYPKSEMIYGEADYRFHHDYQEEYEASIPNDPGCIQSDEAVRVGLQPNPEWEYLSEPYDEETYYTQDLDLVNLMLEMNIPNDEKAKYEAILPAAKERKKQQDEWDAAYDDFIQVIEAKLFIALKEGRLKAFGKPVTLDKDGFQNGGGEHEEIPTKHWRQDDIKWTASASENKTGHYSHIYVETDQLFELFPPPDAEDTKHISVVAGQYVIDEENTEKIKIPHKKGRPSYDWPSFYMELMDRHQAGNIPNKQEAFIAEMQQWCKDNWGKDVARSTLLEKISPFYNRYVRK